MAHCPTAATAHYARRVKRRDLPLQAFTCGVKLLKRMKWKEEQKLTRSLLLSNRDKHKQALPQRCALTQNLILKEESLWEWEVNVLTYPGHHIEVMKIYREWFHLKLTVSCDLDWKEKKNHQTKPIDKNNNWIPAARFDRRKDWLKRLFAFCCTSETRLLICI